MPAISLEVEGDGKFPELLNAKIHHVTQDIKLSALRGGMQSGATSVMFVMPLDDGSYVCCETSLKLLRTATKVLEDYYDEKSK